MLRLKLTASAVVALENLRPGWLLRQIFALQRHPTEARQVTIVMEERIYATGMAYRLRSQWDRDEGLGQNHKAVKFLGQDYERLRTQSLQSGRLFEDNLFPCSASSLGFNELGPRSSKTFGVHWMRPTVRNRAPKVK